jgi:hypothetical protein
MIENKVQINKEEVRIFIKNILWEEIPKILEAQKEQKDELLTISRLQLFVKNPDSQSTIGFEVKNIKILFRDQSE